MFHLWQLPIEAHGLQEARPEACKLHWIAEQRRETNGNSSRDSPLVRDGIIEEEIPLSGAAKGEKTEDHDQCILCRRDAEARNPNEAKARSLRRTSLRVIGSPTWLQLIIKLRGIEVHQESCGQDGHQDQDIRVEAPTPDSVQDRMDRFVKEDAPGGVAAIEEPLHDEEHNVGRSQGPQEREACQLAKGPQAAQGKEHNRTHK
mmetsp:Transcript_61424/g.155148  ORF Transcript_61424/g.155148 Transcript_61424/m.155148 type:complete len:203 (+) Transcript_61424:51-659(+)